MSSGSLGFEGIQVLCMLALPLWAVVTGVVAHGWYTRT